MGKGRRREERGMEGKGEESGEEKGKGEGRRGMGGKEKLNSSGM